MSLPLPEKLQYFFHQKTHRGFDALEGNRFDSLFLGGDSEGKWVRLGFVIDQGKMKKIRFLAAGDPYLIAIFSWFCSQVEGKSLTEIGAMDVAELADRFEFPDHKLSCLLLLEEAINGIKISQ